MTVFDLLITDKEQVNLTDIHLNDSERETVVGLLREHRFVDELKTFGLLVNNKILLYGSSGCGKTMTAKAIAKALNKTILILNLSNIISARVGETSQHLKMVFDKAAREKAVLFLDEFDQIGKARENDSKDVGEMRRLVNTIIQLFDYFPENALLICATNHIDIIDPALVRRFQLKLKYEMPRNTDLDVFYDGLLAKFPERFQQTVRRYDISFAEAKDYIFTRLKNEILDELESKVLKEMVV
ncbi:AAA family ATPase [Pedobacter miscanthi]|uniref:ATPase n=1 Tax=Pedobacter miscanthi TaxID=2259170 RepID=A0A366KR63_9SPHI|nr:ATP-binding protein [Pedobacter miscanthi]RBQ03624.1 ATPase [Pedobacter miscanthi]